MVKVDLSGAQSFFDGAGPDFNAAAQAHRTLSEKTGPGNDFIGWPELPETIKNGELKRLISVAQKIRSRSKYLVVIGIGGSYLGARGAIELLKPAPGPDDTKVIFVGNGLSPDALNRAIQEIGDDDFDINVISKSGTTLEPAIAFRIFRELLDKKYGADAGKHIFATTDARRGVLKSLADANGWESFVVPDDVGGRFSVFSAVGLLPMAVAGIDVRLVDADHELTARLRRDDGEAVHEEGIGHGVGVRRDKDKGVDVGDRRADEPVFALIHLIDAALAV